MKFIDVYSKRNGQKRSIPEHWLDIPSLMAPFRKTPKQRRTDRDDTPDSTPKADESPKTPGSPDSAPVETNETPHDGENDKE